MCNIIIDIKLKKLHKLANLFIYLSFYNGEKEAKIMNLLSLN